MGASSSSKQLFSLYRPQLQILGDTQMLSNVGKFSITLTISAVIGLINLPTQAALLVSSSGDNSVKQYDETTGAYIRDFVTAGSGGLASPQDLAIGPNGNLFVSSQLTNSVKEYDGITGEFIGDFVSADDGLRSPIGLSFGADGSLFVVSYQIPGANTDGVERGGILQYDGDTGKLLNSIITGAPGFSPAPLDVAVDGPSDNVYISESFRGFNPGGIREYDLVTNNFTGLQVGPAPLSTLPFSPQGLALEDNNLFFSNSQEVGLINLADNTVDSLFIDKGSGGLREAVGITIDKNDNLFVVSSATNNIKQYDGQTGDFLGDFIASGSGGLSRPTYITSANVPVPEPSSVLGAIALGGLFVGTAWQRRTIRKQSDSSIF
ncbi:Vgb family protein [Aliterella atlantica]|uniref:Ice-binding protein C-terminal domain-containing protein n=1 Tax=Aliterella atlantica CENA595 TaxID=1618023 RepID=A0A0D8ZQF7_9CYAN|nr:PEP-CTERM sorting domain-containing protein [Aliterella atlantica]KJH69441.1 hypothetical protein UH38_23775 [Aliterella atlantica CENA595]